MYHSMKLQPNPFEQIKNGSKTIEVRLNDEKRRHLVAGDIIEFSMLSDPNIRLHVTVLELLPFLTFKELFATFPPVEYGAGSTDEYVRMYQYYTREEEEKWGVLGIRVELLISKN